MPLIVALQQKDYLEPLSAFHDIEEQLLGMRNGRAFPFLFLFALERECSFVGPGRGASVLGPKIRGASASCKHICNFPSQAEPPFSLYREKLGNHKLFKVNILLQFWDKHKVSKFQKNGIKLLVLNRGNKAPTWTI
ncbi:MAG: hypothetical protein FWG12_02745 [Holophagaceae bacterium]|jgi:hypothetical protein|nr:hypothetical protein [Holophagaceae bacterium]